MKLQSLNAILHPSELKGRDRRRYWVAVATWLVLVLALFALFSAVLILGTWLLISAFGEEIFKPYEHLFLVAIIVNGVAGVFLGDRVWLYLFIKCDYLSDAALIRILSNRAPTRKDERRQRWIGQVVLLLIYGTLGVMAIVSGQWWVLVFAVPLAIWGVVWLLKEWSETENVLAGGPMRPESEERIRYIDEILDERRRHKKKKL